MVDSRIKIRHLQCFLAVADQGSLQKAAGKLSVSQPALSKTLKELEALLAVRLFERGRLGAALTPAGTAFMQPARACVEALRGAVASVAPSSGLLAASVGIGVLPTVAPILIGPLLAGLDAAGSRTKLRIVTGSNPELLARLRQRELDLVLGRFAEPAQMAGLSFEHLYADPLVLALRPGHPLLDDAAQRGDPLAHLQNFTLILPTAGTAIRQSADSFLLARGLDAAALRTIETLSVSIAREYTLASDAVWVSPLGAIERDLQRGTLAALPVSMAGTEELVGLSLRADMQASAAETEVLGLIRLLAAQRRLALP